MTRRGLRHLFLLFMSIISPSVFGRVHNEPPPSVQEQSINIQFKARLLEPGLKKSEGNEVRGITFGPVNWDSPDNGVVMARMWNVTSLVEFELALDRHAFQSLRITPVSRNSAENPWNVWRHRYGFEFVPGQGYFWNTLEVEKEPLETSQAIFFDRYLKDVWSYWTIKRLPGYLASSSSEKNNADITPTNEDPSVAVLSYPLTVKYDTKGLLGRYPVNFQIYLADVPVKVFFDVESSSSGAAGRVVITGGVHWSYDRAQWRQRHGYQKTFLNGYEWENEFPTKKDLTDKDGALLDSLFEHAIDYWVDVAVAQALGDLNRKIAHQVSQLQLEIDAYNDAQSEN